MADHKCDLLDCTVEDRCRQCGRTEAEQERDALLVKYTAIKEVLRYVYMQSRRGFDYDTFMAWCQALYGGRGETKAFFTSDEFNEITEYVTAAGRLP